MNRFIVNHPILALLALAFLVVVGPYAAIWLSRSDDDKDER